MPIIFPSNQTVVSNCERRPFKSRLLQCSPIAQSIHASAFYCWAMWRKAQCCQGWCCHFADRFCLTARRLRASPQRESLIKFPFIPASLSSSPGITLHYNTLTYAHILLSHFSLFMCLLSLSLFLLLFLSLSPSASFAAPSTTHSHPTLSHPPLLPSINTTVFSLNKKSTTVEEFLLCRLVWCAVMKGHGDREAY